MTAAANPIVTGRPRPGPGLRCAGGFTYLSLIIIVAIIGMVAATGLKLGGVVQRSLLEEELLHIGAEFSDALQSYADATPAGQPRQPPSLKELLRDPRFPGVRRHLRKIYIDPMTGSVEWGIVYLADKVGVVGVYSLSEAQPVKIGNFPSRFQGFSGKSHLSEWKFTLTGKVARAGADNAPVSEPIAAALAEPLVEQPLAPRPGKAEPSRTPAPPEPEAPAPEPAEPDEAPAPPAEPRQD